MNSSGTQMPSLSPLSTFRPWRTRSGRRCSRDDGLPERGVGGGEHDRQDDRLGRREAAEQRRRDAGRRGDRQRQADTEQPQRHGVLPPQRAQVDARGVGEEHDARASPPRARDLGRGRRALAASTWGPSSTPIARKTICASPACRRAAARRRDGEHREGEQRQIPLHRQDRLCQRPARPGATVAARARQLLAKMRRKNRNTFRTSRKIAAASGIASLARPCRRRLKSTTV